MKQGITTHLAVEFDIPVESMSKVEFAFSRGLLPSEPPEKISVWPGDVKRKPGENIMLVPFSSDETYKFQGQFFMDTRITLIDSIDQPETEIITLQMSKTLFEG